MKTLLIIILFTLTIAVTALDLSNTDDNDLDMFVDTAIIEYTLSTCEKDSKPCESISGVMLIGFTVSIIMTVCGCVIDDDLSDD